MAAWEGRECPLCGAGPVQDAACGRCGSLEGLEDEASALQCRRPGRLFAFDWGAGSLSPFLATPGAALERLLAFLEERELGASALVGDLGSGDGAVLVAAAQRLGCRCWGVELDRGLVAAADARAAEAGVAARVRFECEDLTATSNAQWQRCAVLVLHLLPQALRRLEPRLAAAAAAGTTVVTVTWPAAGLAESPGIRAASRGGLHVYEGAGAAA